MKEKILTFVIGCLVGAIVATGAFLVYEKVTSQNNVPNQQSSNSNMQNFGPGGKMQPPDKQNGFEGGTPPDMQNGDNAQSIDTTQNADSINGNSSTTQTNQKGQKGGMKGNFNPNQSGINAQQQQKQTKTPQISTDSTNENV